MACGCLTTMRLDEYFALHRAAATYEIGTKVFGKYNKIPFIGTVGPDGMMNDEAEPHVTVVLVLPLSHKGKTHNVIRVPLKSVKALKQYD